MKTIDRSFIKYSKNTNTIMCGVFLSLNQGCYKDKTKANVVLIAKCIITHMRAIIYGYDIETNE